MKIKKLAKQKSLSQLKKILWQHFSLFIRRRDNYTCFTCGRKGEGSGIHAGHFINKSIGGVMLYFNEENVNAQCYRCNIHLGGNIWEYGQRLGAEKVETLYRIREQYKDWQFDRKDYEQMIERYKKLCG